MLHEPSPFRSQVADDSRRATIRPSMTSRSGGSASPHVMRSLLARNAAVKRNGIVRTLPLEEMENAAKRLRDPLLLTAGLRAEHAEAVSTIEATLGDELRAAECELQALRAVLSIDPASRLGQNQLQVRGPQYCVIEGLQTKPTAAWHELVRDCESKLPAAQSRYDQAKAAYDEAIARIDATFFGSDDQ